MSNSSLEEDEISESHVSDDDAEHVSDEDAESNSEQSSRKISEQSVGLEQEEFPGFQRYRDPLDDLTNQQLIELVNDMEVQNRHLQLESTVFMDFLKKYSPSSLEGLEQLINYAVAIATKQSQPFLATKLSTETEESDSQSIVSLAKSSRRSIKADSLPSISTLVEGRGPKINISTKTDMIVKAIEETQQSLEAFIKKSLRTKRNLRSELQEYSIRENDITESRNSFEYNIVTQGVDKLTQRIPAEKWIRFMEEWLKSSALVMEKLRLRTASLRIQYKKVSAVLVQRQELGENVHAVDFDQLEIANKHLQSKIDQKQVHLVELKRMNGGANLVLSRHKKYLLAQQIDYNRLKEGIAQKEKQIEELDEEYDKVEADRTDAKDKFERFKEFKNTYRVPEVMEYVLLKKEVDELKKNIKIWQRRKNIQDISLSASIRQMKNLTGCPVVDPAWLEDAPPEIDDEWL